MIRLKELISEAVPFAKSPTVAQRLEKTKIPTISPETFGIDLEYEPSGEDFDASDHKDSIIDDMTGGRMWRTNEAYYDEWLQGRREYYNRNYGFRGRDWDDSYGPIDLDTWESHNAEPSPEEFYGTTDSEDDDDAAYKAAHNEWTETRSDVDYTYRKWIRNDKNDFANDWAEEMIDDGDWTQYSSLTPDELDDNSMAAEISKARSFIENNIGDPADDEDGTASSWGVGEDGSNVEIRSKHLTTSEFDKVKKILSFVRNKTIGGDTSAHVHIGLPSKFDAFDVIAMSDLVDEDSIQKAIGNDRNYSEWAKLNYDLAGDILRALSKFFKKYFKNYHKLSEGQIETDGQDLIELIDTGWVIKLSTLDKILHDNMMKNRGTNLSAFWSHRTIEFRYWSSDAAARNPDNFIQWIRYFLLLPKVAHKRNKITIGTGRADSFVCSREGTSHVRIELEDKFKETLLKKLKSKEWEKNQLNFDFGK